MRQASFLANTRELKKSFAIRIAKKKLRLPKEKG